jgi:hypothetical protein
MYVYQVMGELLFAIVALVSRIAAAGTCPSVCVCVYVCMCVCVCVYIYMYIYIYIYIYMHGHVHIPVYVHTLQICVQRYTHTCMHAFHDLELRVCNNCIHTYLRIHTYIHVIT